MLPGFTLNLMMLMTFMKRTKLLESNQVTSKIAYGLKQDLFQQADQVIEKTQPYKAVLRFAHAEIIIPLATSLDLHSMMQPLALHQTYSYATSTWRGETVSPMAANIQWDIYQNPQGHTLVKMLYNEKKLYLNQLAIMHVTNPQVFIMIIKN